MHLRLYGLVMSLALALMSYSAVNSVRAQTDWAPVPPMNYTWSITKNDIWFPHHSSNSQGDQLVFVPAGEFEFVAEEGADGINTPINAPFWVDRYEVTNAQVNATEVGRALPPGSITGDNHPRDKIKWQEAQNVCLARGGSLLTEIEWQYIASGPEGSVYPWGDTAYTADDISKDYSIYRGNSGDNNADDDYSDGHVAEVGGREAGASWVGAEDLSGNLAEWVIAHDPAAPDAKKAFGGSYTNAIEDTSTHDFATYGSDANPLFVGFRCKFAFVDPGQIPCQPEICVQKGPGNARVRVVVSLESCEKWMEEKGAFSCALSGSFWIDRYEYTVGRRDSGMDLTPLTLSWQDAKNRCESEGGYLPSEDQWKYAAFSPWNFNFPWGSEKRDDFIIHNANSDGPRNVGSILHNVSWVGALDMLGNVAEWVQKDNPTDVSVATALGGSWSLGTGDRRVVKAPNDVFPDIGFRCAYDDV